MDVRQAKRKRRVWTVQSIALGQSGLKASEEPPLLPYTMCEVTDFRGRGRGVPVEAAVQGIGVRPSRASSLGFQAAVKVGVRTDDGDRVHELGLIIKQTTNLYSTFITGKVPAPHAIYHVIEL